MNTLNDGLNPGFKPGIDGAFIPPKPAGGAPDRLCSLPECRNGNVGPEWLKLGRPGTVVGPDTVGEMAFGCDVLICENRLKSEI